MLRLVQLVGGVLAGVAGAGGLAYALLAPTQSYAITVGTASGTQVLMGEPESLLGAGVPAETAIQLAALALGTLAVATGAVWHATRGERRGLALLIGGTAVLLVGALGALVRAQAAAGAANAVAAELGIDLPISVSPTGAEFLPVAVCAVVAAVCGWRRAILTERNMDRFRA